MTEPMKKVLTGPYAGLRIVTPKTIYETVMNDGPTYVWFTKLVFKDLVVKELALKDAAVTRFHQSYQVYTAMVVLMFLVSVVGWGAVILEKGAVPKWGLSPSLSLMAVLLGLISAAGVFLFLAKRREQIARLSSMLIERNLTEDPLGMTLYHMGEIYARKYQVPSLVEVIRSWDLMLKYVFIYMYYGAFGVYFLSFKDSLIWTLGGCIVAMSVYQVFFLLRRR